MINMLLAKNVIERLLEAGVKEFCLCPGARNSPFICIFDENKSLQTYHFFDERSAGFFALGRIAATRSPVAVITTSGTAVAEILPAAVEGTYSSLPLMIVTADRPKSYRGSGAPQSIEQVGLFSYYIEASFDLDEANTHISLKNLSWKKPVHINVCFQEPLLDGPVPQIPIPSRTHRERFPLAVPMDLFDKLEYFLEKNNPLVIVSTLPERLRDTALNFLQKLNMPIYAEGISGIKNHPSIQNKCLISGDKSAEILLEKKLCDSVLRLGGVPTLKLWRKLEKEYAEVPVMSLGFNHYTGLSRPIDHYVNMEEISRLETDKANVNFAQIIELDRQRKQRLDQLLEKFPFSEQSILRKLSQHLDKAYVYLGNSLPIREWDLTCHESTLPERVAGNRGANGIDGQISSFLGWARTAKENWCIVGDLTALYDLSSLWICNQLKDTPLRVVIINNRGGQIFRSMFQREIFVNSHQLNFSHWAKMWNWEYLHWSEIPQALPKLGQRQLIELQVDNEQTQQFLKEWNEK